MAEKPDDQTPCQYWQTCNFSAIKSKTCEVVASRVVALVIPIVILLLTTAIFAIYCFKKRADRAEETNKELVDRLPDFNASTRSGSGGNPHDTANVTSIYNKMPSHEITPG